MDFRFRYDRHKPSPEVKAEETRREQDAQRGMRGLGAAMNITTTLVTGVVGGYFLGSWLDARLHWQFATILCLLLGIAGSFYLVVKMLEQVNQN